MKFSVITPVYNAGKYLPIAMESLRSQSFTEWEAVLVDDGSTDDSLAIASALAKEYGRIRVFHQPNRGVSASRNRGMDESRGDWVLWLDQDDRYVPCALEKVAGICDANPGCECLQFPYFKMGSDGSCTAAVSRAYSESLGTGLLERLIFKGFSLVAASLAILLMGMRS